jgi:hypothetical protein
MNTENQLVKQQNEPVFNFFDPVQFETMQRICRMFANSELVPDMYKIAPVKTDTILPNASPEERAKAIAKEEMRAEAKAMANCMIAVEMAQRIGASPLMIMQNMVIIYGRPSWSSKFLVATVNTCGRFNPLQYKFTEKGMLGKVDYTEYEKVWIPGTNGGKGYYKNNAKTVTFDGTKVMDIECIAFTAAKGSDKILESSPVSIRLAIQEGWYTKAGSKWQTMTKQMLMYRAASFWTNAYAPELSMGMKTEDEIRDIVDIDYEEVKNDVVSKVDSEIADKANTGTAMSFDNPPAGPKDEVKAEETKENESTDQLPAGPHEQHASNGNNKIPGF